LIQGALVLTTKNVIVQSSIIDISLMAHRLSGLGIRSHYDGNGSGMKVNLDELDKLSKDAMPAPWRDDIATCEDATGAYACGPFHASNKYNNVDVDTDNNGEALWDIDSHKDAKLITAMRNNIDAMIAELRAAREVVVAAEQIEEFFGSDDRDRIEKALEKYRALK